MASNANALILQQQAMAQQQAASQFGIWPSAAPEQPTPDWEAKVLLPAVLREEMRLLADAAELFETFRLDHEKDVAGFRFECKLHGQWLQIQMERLGLEKFATTLNLMQTTNFSMNYGYEPSRDSELMYEYYQFSGNISVHAVGGKSISAK